ncbi:MAG: transglycosylase domain-containing protein, partial [Clostridia bacterium]|nr:transglycosylase domain-containing protein [Clostridia bacterium]
MIKKNPSGGNKAKGRSSIWSKVLSVLFTILLIGLITGTIVGAAFALYLRSFIDISIDDILLLSTDQDQTTQLYYMDYTDRANRIGEAVLIEDQQLSAGENRVWASYSEMPDDLVNAFIAIEDKDFRDHKGVDWGRTLSATFYFFAPGDKHYGGSTITQQVIKNVTGNDDITIQRKVQEIFMALNLEKKLDKSEIIEIYLNTIYLSQRSYGVQAAAQTYFGKDVSELTLLECAALASIPQAPTKWDPVQNPDNNTDRRKVVLTAMRDQGLITEDEYLEAWHAELVLNTDAATDDSSDRSYNSWYTDQVINDAIELLMDEDKLGLSKDLATRMIYTGGLKIYTLMDPDVQGALEEYFENPENFAAMKGPLSPKCSMVVIDPYTGDVLGLVGDKGEKQGDRLQNYATQTRRSPGSSIKPLSVYGPALEEGYITYASAFDDIPIDYGEDNDSPWPSNNPPFYMGLTPVYDAVTRSVNTVAIRVLQQLGTATSFDYVKNKLHIDGFIENQELENGTVLSDLNASALALGGMTYGVTVEEMTAAYSIFV